MPKVKPEGEFKERVVFINRVSKVVKGGKRFGFSALVVVGNENGQVGFALGKAKEVSSAIRKGVEKAKKNLINVPLKGTTIPHDIIGHFGASKILLKPASEGTGVIAESAVRAVLELAGIKDVLTKSLGSNNPINLVQATYKALSEMRTREDWLRIRGKLRDKVEVEANGVQASQN